MKELLRPNMQDKLLPVLLTSGRDFPVEGSPGVVDTHVAQTT